MDLVLWTFAEIILATMLQLAPCGRSAYSAVAIADGVSCDTSYTPGCRLENETECLARYRRIAQAIAEVSGGNRNLAAHLVSVGLHESGFRKDTHAGIGAHARGDDGQSCSLFQRLLGRRGTTWRGWGCADIEGTDLPATRRAVAAAAEVLIAGEDSCNGWRPACVVAFYGQVRSEKDERVVARAKTCRRVRGLL